jgi:hypothetical protein
MWVVIGDWRLATGDWRPEFRTKFNSFNFFILSLRFFASFASFALKGLTLNLFAAKGTPESKSPERSLRQAPARHATLAAFAESGHNLGKPDARSLALIAPKNRIRRSDDRRNIPQH